MSRCMHVWWVGGLLDYVLSKARHSLTSLDFLFCPSYLFTSDQRPRSVLARELAGANLFVAPGTSFHRI